MADVFKVSKRDTHGTKRVRRLRASGLVPAVLYGHGAEPVSLSIAKTEVEAAVNLGHHLVNLTGDVTTKALVKDVQWNTFGNRVLHLDLARVSEGETVEVTLSVHLHGEAAGLKNGGHIEHPVHEVTISCPIDVMPEHLELNVSSLEVGQALHASDIPLPAKASLVDDPETLIVHCVEARAAAADDEGEDASAEPEVIKKDKGEADDE